MLFIGTDTLPSAGRLVAQIDVAPTLLKRLGALIPTSWEGTPIGQEANFRQIYLEARDKPKWKAVICTYQGHTYKYIFSTAAHRANLFDLSVDFAEKNDLLASASADLLNGLRRDAANYFGIAEPLP